MAAGAYALLFFFILAFLTPVATPLPSPTADAINPAGPRPGVIKPSVGGALGVLEGGPLEGALAPGVLAAEGGRLRGITIC